MSTAAVSPESWIAAPAPRLLTAADLAAMPDELPSGPVKYELEDGRLVVMPLPGGIHGAINANIVYQAGHPPKIVAPAEDFTAEGIIPGFRLNVGEVLRT